MSRNQLLLPLVKNPRPLGHVGVVARTMDVSPAPLAGRAQMGHLAVKTELDAIIARWSFLGTVRLAFKRNRG